MRSIFLPVNIIICIMHQLIKTLWSYSANSCKNVDNLFSEIIAMQKNPTKDEITCKTAHACEKKYIAHKTQKPLESQVPFRFSDASVFEALELEKKGI